MGIWNALALLLALLLKLLLALLLELLLALLLELLDAGEVKSLTGEAKLEESVGIRGERCNETGSPSGLLVGENSSSELLDIDRFKLAVRAEYSLGFIAELPDALLLAWEFERAIGLRETAGSSC